MDKKYIIFVRFWQKNLERIEIFRYFAPELKKILKNS